MDSYSGKLTNTLDAVRERVGTIEMDLIRADRRPLLLEAQLAPVPDLILFVPIYTLFFLIV
jgi:hypothetical protein